MTGPANHVVDATGKACPVPVIELAKAAGEVDAGATIELLADDPGAKVDIPVWCRMKGAELVDVAEVDGVWHFRVRPG